jgi:hypothetical protein
MAREILSKRNFFDFESPDSVISRSPMTLMNSMGADMQKPYTSKCGQGKIKIDLFRDFLQKMPISKL